MTIIDIRTTTAPTDTNRLTPDALYATYIGVHDTLKQLGELSEHITWVNINFHPRGERGPTITFFFTNDTGHLVECASLHLVSADVAAHEISSHHKELRRRFIAELKKIAQRYTRRGESITTLVENASG